MNWEWERPSWQMIKKENKHITNFLFLLRENVSILKQLLQNYELTCVFIAKRDFPVDAVIHKHPCSDRTAPLCILRNCESILVFSPCKEFDTGFNRIYWCCIDPLKDWRLILIYSPAFPSFSRWLFPDHLKHQI